jgi:DNA-binding FrmR family transcriptional regulator
MAHTTKSKSRLQARVRRIRGQIEAIERGLDAEVGCNDILQLVASVRGAMNGLMVELVEDHLRNHVIDARTHDERVTGGEELIDVIKSYVK